MLETYIEETQREKKRIFNIARSKYHLKEEAIEDIYQESFLYLLNGGIKSYDVNRKFLPWFIKCFLNKCVDYLRKETPYIKRVRHLDLKNIDKIKSLWYINHENIFNCEISERVDKLPNRFKEAVKLGYWLNMKEREIAEKLGTPRATIRWRLNKARKKLSYSLVSFNDKK